MMGGPGSGNWWRWQRKKQTVESSLDIGLKQLRKRLFAGAAGSMTWTWGSGRKSSIGYRVTSSGDGLAVHLDYRWGDKEDVHIPVRLEQTPTQFGGQRWWFICPLIVGGHACNRRAGKLYLPPGAKYFGCRKCHDLTYRSSQEAHQTERLFGRLGLDAEDAKLWERMHRRK
jgi:hypothetical protein